MQSLVHSESTMSFAAAMMCMKAKDGSDSWLCRYLNRAAFLSANGMWLPIPPLLCSKVLKIVSKIRDKKKKKNRNL